MIDDTDAIEASVSPLPVELYDQEAIAIFLEELTQCQKSSEFEKWTGEDFCCLRKREDELGLGGREHKLERLSPLRKFPGNGWPFP
jgi:hypothetical protein